MRATKRITWIALLTFMLFAGLSYAESAGSKADLAVAEILFEYDGAEEFASYKVAEDGFVDITFAVNTPDSLYSEILGKLNSHTDINGVLAGKTGSFCSLF